MTKTTRSVGLDVHKATITVGRGRLGASGGGGNHPQ